MSSVRFFFPSKLTKIIYLFILSNGCHASFYQAGTLGEYCGEYLKFISLEKPVSQLEAGVCSGYVASSIELMSLSKRLCDKGKINLDAVIKHYVDYIEKNVTEKNRSATYVLVNLLQQQYSCDKSSSNNKP